MKLTSILWWCVRARAAPDEAIDKPGETREDREIVRGVHRERDAEESAKRGSHGFVFGGCEKFGHLQTRGDGGERCSSVNGFVFDSEGQSKKSDTGAEGGRQHEPEEDAQEHRRNLSKRRVLSRKSRESTSTVM